MENEVLLQELLDSYQDSDYPDGFLNPEVSEGKKLGSGSATVVLDDDYQSKGIKVGDKILDSASGKKLKVVGFTKDAMYGHTSVGYLSTGTYRSIMKKTNPMYQESVHAAAVRGAKGKTLDGTKTYTKQTIVQAIPGYQAEQMTIKMVEWLLVVITALIIGIFFFVINLQKEKEYGVLKAIGTGMGSLVRMILCQVLLIAVCGAAVAAGLVVLMSAALPQTMPFFLVWNQVAKYSTADEKYCEKLPGRRSGADRPGPCESGSESRRVRSDRRAVRLREEHTAEYCGHDAFSGQRRDLPLRGEGVGASEEEMDGDPEREDRIHLPESPASAVSQSGRTAVRADGNR